jgi:hypothetical protein
VAGNVLRQGLLDAHDLGLAISAEAATRPSGDCTDVERKQPRGVSANSPATSVSGQVVVSDRDDLELLGAARRAHRDDVADRRFQ